MTGAHLLWPALLAPPPKRRGRSSRVRRLGYTLLEIMIVVTIVGVLAYITVPIGLRAGYRAHVTTAISDLRALQGDIDLFELERGRVPNDLAEIGRALQMDPWGRPYQYLSFAAAGSSWKAKARKDLSLVPLNSTYDLYSMGKDGKTAIALSANASWDDIVRANDGGFVGLGASY